MWIEDRRVGEVRASRRVLHAFVAAALGLTGGCASLAAGGGTYARVSGAETRVASGNLGLGGWFAIRRQVVIDLHNGYELGPLGRRSNWLLTLGGRVTTRSHGWRPGYYGALLGGFNQPASEDRKAGPSARAVRAGLGVAWTSFTEEDGVLGPAGYASALLGVAYHHQEQSHLGAGDFLGIELTLVAGGDLLFALGEGTKDD